MRKRENGSLVMSDGNATGAEQVAATYAARTADPLLLAPYEIGMAIYRHWLGATARLLQDQSAHLRNLAECDNPFNLLVYQTEFAEKSVVAGLDELRRGVDSVTDTACEQLAVDRSPPQ